MSASNKYSSSNKSGMKKKKNLKKYVLKYTKKNSTKIRCLSSVFLLVLSSFTIHIQKRETGIEREIIERPTRLKKNKNIFFLHFKTAFESFKRRNYRFFFLDFPFFFEAALGLGLLPTEDSELEVVVAEQPP